MEGDYYGYDEKGIRIAYGEYINNLKEKTWYQYNDTGKIVLEKKYEKGILIETINPDTVKKEIEKVLTTKGEVEASFGKNKKDWVKFLIKNIKSEVAENSVKGGQVMVGYVVDKTGKCTNVYLRKSVEFVLDEEAKRVIEISPLWNPAVVDGKIVKAYRLQPLTFVKQ